MQQHTSAMIQNIVISIVIALLLGFLAHACSQNNLNAARYRQQAAELEATSEGK